MKTFHPNFPMLFAIPLVLLLVIGGVKTVHAIDRGLRVVPEYTREEFQAAGQGYQRQIDCLNAQVGILTTRMNELVRDVNDARMLLRTLLKAPTMIKERRYLEKKHGRILRQGSPGKRIIRKRTPVKKPR